MQTDFERKVELSRMFWKQDRLPHPITAFHIGDYIISSKYHAAKGLLVHGKIITPDMLDVDMFIKDYESMLEAESRAPGDVFQFVGAFSGIPWLEAICGCSVKALVDSFVSMPCIESPEQYDLVKWDDNNPWLCKYLEFLSKLEEAFEGRYTVAETLLRGCVDVCGALLGQMNMIYAMYDDPETTQKLLKQINSVFMTLVDTIISHSKYVYGGYVGPYGIVYPGRPLYFQEDLTSLVTPDQYRELVKPIHDSMCKRYDGSVIHLHPTSFHCLDDILKVEKLSIIQMNKDDGGPSISDMLAAMKKVQQAGKGLVISAKLDNDEIELLLSELEMRALILDLFASDVNEALAMKEFIVEKSMQ